MTRINTVYENLYLELKYYEELGISMAMDGYMASPLQIVLAHMIREVGTYMRDYQMNDQGELETLAFDEVHDDEEDH